MDDDSLDLAELLELEGLPPDHRAGFVAVVGKPNVGKSTLMNAFLGEKLAIVSPRPQTTREQQLGILTRPEAQVIFVDTPGIHRARNKLGEFMVDAAKGAIPNSDIILFLVDASESPARTDEVVAGLVAEAGPPVILALNKIDLVAEADRPAAQQAYHNLLPDAIAVMISAAEGTNVEQLLTMLIEGLPVGPRYYPPDQLTDTYLRENAAEIIREKVLLLFEQEIPHAVAVQVDQFKERDDNMTYIAATIYVERDSQKGIIIGHKGQMLKKLGKEARADLEEMLGTRVFLELWVKVLKNWRRDDNALRRLGYSQKP